MRTFLWLALAAGLIPGPIEAASTAPATVRPSAAAAPGILDASGVPLDDAAAGRLAAAGVRSGKTTLDARAQRIADRALARTLAVVRPAPSGGAIVVLDLRRRAIAALASGPERNRMRAAEALPPGSVVKPFVAVELLSSGVADDAQRYPCPARLRLAGANLRNWRHDDMEPLAMRDAIAHSCNTVFYRLASQAWTQDKGGVERILRSFGFNAPTGILPREDFGFVPDAASERELLSMAIGQGAVLATPLQLAVAYASIATGGRVQPVAVDGAEARSTGVQIAAGPLGVVRGGMRAAVVSGTAAQAMRGIPLNVAAKTGTAEFVARPTAWFAAYAPADDPRYVVVAAFEQGGFGADAAAPAVRSVLEGLFDLPASRDGFIDWRLALILLAAAAVVAVRLVRAVATRRASHPAQ